LRSVTFWRKVPSPNGLEGGFCISLGRSEGDEHVEAYEYQENNDQNIAATLKE
jgi:hypothetical protein